MTQMLKIHKVGSKKGPKTRASNTIKEIKKVIFNNKGNTFLVQKPVTRQVFVEKILKDDNTWPSFEFIKGGDKMKNPQGKVMADIQSV